jgi:predicted RNase H-like HicB family nuclease
MNYAVVFERSETGWGASVPDLPGLAATGPRALDEMRARVRSAIEFHIRSLRESGEPVPVPTTHVEELEPHAA